MSNDAAFYRARAEAEQANAQAATLDNVRDRCTRAAHAWEQMAERAEQTRDQRLVREGAAARARVDALLDTEMAAATAADETASVDHEWPESAHADG
ncbi:MAG: hypothetical protein K2P68_02775 [Sphingomonas sp.]|nr:hypothetical protein [Sphingomonas sp.]